MFVLKSQTVSQPRGWQGISNKIKEINGAPTRTRTADLLITNQLLYQLSYRGMAGRLALELDGRKTNLRLRLVFS